MKLLATESICGHYLPALINGDESGLNSLEVEQVNDWYQDWQQESGGYALTLDVVSEEPSFARDEITGLMADCYDVEVWGAGE